MQCVDVWASRLWLLSVLIVAAAQAEVTLYFDKDEYLNALQANGYSMLRESFEDDDYWGLVRTTITGGTFEAPDVMSQGVTWNGSGGGVHGVTTSEGAASHRDWGFYSSPHSDVLNGINDGFTVSAPEPIFGFGGFLRGTYGADIIMVIDGDEANPVELGEICELDPMGEPINCIDRNLGNTPFVAVIDSHGFTQIEVRETEGGGDETKYIWSDNFTLGFQTLPSVRTPGTAWAQAVDGTYGVDSNWENSAAPPSTGNAVFQLAAAVPYTVDFAQNQFASQMVVSDDQVVLEMNGFTFALDQANPTRESVIVGELPGDSATLSVRDGALTGVNAVIGHSTGTNGHVTVAAAAEFSVSGQLRIGSGGVGALEVTGGGHVSSNITLVGQLAGQGTLNLNGPGTTLDAGLIMVGHSGDAEMTVSNGARAASGNGAIAVAGDATVVVDGATSDWTMSIGGSSRGTLRVGQGDSPVVTTATPVRTGTLTIQNGASVSAEESYVGDLRNSMGIVNVVGMNSTWHSNTSGNTFIGHHGNGVLNVLAGGRVQSGQVLIGRAGVLGETRGVANIDGPGSQWHAASLWVGYNYTTSMFGAVSDGELNITDGGLVAAAQVNIGARNAAHGAVHVSGLDSRLTATNLLLGSTEANPFNNEALLEIGTGGAVDIVQEVSVRHGRILLSGGDLTAADVLIDGGSLEGVGLVNADVENQAVVRPGDAVGTIAVDGNYLQSATGSLLIELGGVGPHQFDQLEMTGSAVLNGLLELSVIDLGLMDTPQPGDLFEILRADGGIVGTFASINGVELSNQLGLAVTYGPDSVVAQAALLGDANLDGVVDLSDFNIWNAYKFTVATNWRTGDFNGDGLTDGSDFNAWNANKFTSAGQPAAVPEPASATMIILLLVALFRSRFV